MNTVDEAKQIILASGDTIDPRTPPGELKLEARAILKRKAGVALNLVTRLNESEYAKKQSVFGLKQKIAACAKAKGVAWTNDDA